MSSTNAPKDSKHSPSREYRFFLYDPNDGITFWRDQTERDKAAEAAIETYLDDDGWSEEVTGVVVGAVTHQAVETNVVERVGELDEDGHDEVGEYWQDSDCTHKCNYALRPFPATTETLDD